MGYCSNVVAVYVFNIGRNTQGSYCNTVSCDWKYMADDRSDGTGPIGAFQSYAIEASQLVKRFGSLVAVDHLDLKVRKGEIYGFLGPNGAGKTTTVRMLTTMDLPDSGIISIDGHPTKTDYIAARRHIGVIQQQHSLEKDISVRENIVHHGLMQNLSKKQIKERMEELCGIMELNDRLDTLVGNLSGGWKKRVAVVCSLIHEPDILFMDEPTTGLDTQSRNILWRMIRSINGKGTTIFLTTHYIFEAENLCDRVGIISHGKLITEGTPNELKSGLGPVALVSADDEGTEHVQFFQTRAEAREASGRIHESHDTMIRSTNLEDVFLELTGGKFRRTTFWARPQGWPTGTSVSSAATWCRSSFPR